MDISSIPDRVWRDIIMGNVSYNFESLSFRIILSNLKLKLTQNPDKEADYLSELKKMVSSQQNLPNLQRDIQKIMEKGGLV
jgi:hypothetical protein